jgi:uncharacterized protein YciI
MFIAISEYLAPVEAIDAVRPIHLAYLEGLVSDGTLLMAGRQDPVVGGVLVFRGSDEAEAQKVVDNDPYTQQGLARYTLTRFAPRIGPITD